MFREIEEETGVRLYEATGVEATAGGEQLVPLAFPSEKKGRVVWDDRAIDLAVVELIQGCAVQGNVLGMDCEWELPFGGASESPVCTLQLALPDGTAYLFHLQRGSRGTTSATFNRSLKRLLNDEGISKVSLSHVVFLDECTHPPSLVCVGVVHNACFSSSLLFMPHF